MEATLRVNIRQLTEQLERLEGKLPRQESVKLPNIGVLASGGVIAMSPFPWVHDLIRSAAEADKEEARRRALGDT